MSSWWTLPMSRDEFDATVAARAEIQRASKFGGHITNVNTILDTDERGLRAAWKVRMACTNLDHVYPLDPKPGTPCLCGDRKWGETNSPRRLRKTTIDSVPQAATVEPPPTTSETKEGMKDMTDQSTAPEAANAAETADTGVKTLKLRAVLGGGLCAYALDGVRGSLTISKSMFADPANPPAELQVTTTAFAAPSGATVKAKETSEAKLKRQAEREAKRAEAKKKADERAAAAKARAQKALKLAQEAEARAAKLAPKTAEAPAAETATEATSDTPHDEAAQG